jgi:hypothetical protein
LIILLLLFNVCETEVLDFDCSMWTYIIEHSFLSISLDGGGGCLLVPNDTTVCTEWRLVSSLSCLLLLG